MAYKLNGKTRNFAYYNGTRIRIAGAYVGAGGDIPDVPDAPPDIIGYWLWTDVDEGGYGDTGDFSARYSTAYNNVVLLRAPLISESETYSMLRINQGGYNLAYGTKVVYDTNNYPVWIDEAYRLIKIETSYHDIEDYSSAMHDGVRLLEYLEKFAMRVVRFYIGEKDYLAKLGATWRNWAIDLNDEDIVMFGEYDFSPPSITLDGNNAVMLDGYYIRKSNGETVYADDLIEGDLTYQLAQ